MHHSLRNDFDDLESKWNRFYNRDWNRFCNRNWNKFDNINPRTESRKPAFDLFAFSSPSRLFAGAFPVSRRSVLKSFDFGGLQSLNGGIEVIW